MEQENCLDLATAQPGEQYYNSAQLAIIQPLEERRLAPSVSLFRGAVIKIISIESDERLGRLIRVELSDHKKDSQDVVIVADGIEHSLDGKHPLKGGDWKKDRRVGDDLKKGSDRSKKIASRDDAAIVEFRCDDKRDHVRKLALKANDLESSREIGVGL